MITRNIDVKILKSDDSEKGIFEVIASSGKVDRMGDTIDPNGWYLNNYKKNPVLLWSHSTGGMFGSVAVPPVAKATKVWVENKKELRIKGEWADTSFAQELRTLVEGGFLNAVSVGFQPLKEDAKGAMEIDGKMYSRATEAEIEKSIYDNDFGQKFTKQELLEVSWVSVPALPQALVTARKMNLNLLTKAIEGQDAKVNALDVKILKEVGGTLTVSQIKNIARVYEEKSGQVLSAKNRTLINNSVKQMGTATDALKELLKATESATEVDEPNKSVAPAVKKGRIYDKTKGRVLNPELRLMRLADRAVEEALRSLKGNRLQRKAEISFLRVASKATDAALIQVKK